MGRAVRRADTFYSNRITSLPIKWTYTLHTDSQCLIRGVRNRFCMSKMFIPKPRENVSRENENRQCAVVIIGSRLFLLCYSIVMARFLTRYYRLFFRCCFNQFQVLWPSVWRPWSDSNWVEFYRSFAFRFRLWLGWFILGIHKVGFFETLFIQ